MGDYKISLTFYTTNARGCLSNYFRNTKHKKVTPTHTAKKILTIFHCVGVSMSKRVFLPPSVFSTNLFIGLIKSEEMPMIIKNAPMANNAIASGGNHNVQILKLISPNPSKIKDTVGCLTMVKL